MRHPPHREYYFSCLSELWPDLFALAVEAEELTETGPDFATLRLRQMAEKMVILIFEKKDLTSPQGGGQFERLSVLKNNGCLPEPVLSRFHKIRILGNKAAHEGTVHPQQTRELLTDAEVLAAWFCRFMRPELDWGQRQPSASARSAPLGNDGVQQPENHARTADSAVSAAFPSTSPLHSAVRLRDVFSIPLNADQIRCVDALQAFLEDDGQRLFLLKGYAGTGKTFLAKGLTEYLLAQGRQFTLAAPTGRAAKIIGEKTGHPANTLHKLIYDYATMEEEGAENEGSFKMIAKVAQNESAINAACIVDEASLISDIYNESEFFRSGSGFLLKDLLAFMGLADGAMARKLILLGDPAQLPPVGMNRSPALDVDYLQERYGIRAAGYTLTEVVRQKAESSVLKNVMPLRESLEQGRFSSLHLTFDDEVIRLDADSAIGLYLKVHEQRGEQAPVIVTFSNAEAAAFNRAVRARLFPGHETVCAGDRVIVAANGFCAGHYLANGEFLRIAHAEPEVERRTVALKRKNAHTGVVETREVPLTFREVTVVLPSDDGEMMVSAKNLEDFLHGSNGALEADMQRALYVDFIRRHKHLDRKRDRDAFQIALLSDPYFNALRLRFGYAITCHKAQGSEWSHVIVKCPTGRNPRSEDFFRWLYTAMTRTSDKLYLVDPPNVQLKPAGTGWNNTEAGPSVSTDARSKFRNNGPVVDVAPAEAALSPQAAFRQWLQSEVRQALATTEIEIEDIARHPYLEVFYLKRGSDAERIDVNYKGDFNISNVFSARPGALAEEVLPLLEPLKGRRPSVASGEAGEVLLPTRPFLRSFHERLVLALASRRIELRELKEQQWSQRYTLGREGDEVTVDIFFNGKDQLTRFMPIRPARHPGPSLAALQNDVQAILETEVRP